jgi:hypothetical protein
LVLLVRIRCKVLDEGVDLVDQPLAACIERRGVERRIAVDAVEGVFGEDSTKRSRDRNAAFGIDLIGECGDKLVHLPLMRARTDQ